MTIKELTEKEFEDLKEGMKDIRSGRTLTTKELTKVLKLEQKRVRFRIKVWDQSDWE